MVFISVHQMGGMVMMVVVVEVGSAAAVLVPVPVAVLLVVFRQVHRMKDSYVIVLLTDQWTIIVVWITLTINNYTLQMEGINQVGRSMLMHSSHLKMVMKNWINYNNNSLSMAQMVLSHLQI
ncbi:unnamed protein product [Trichobilharzia regenti]|nr:unnamed protein product [Trichobilharzia regenti]